MNALLQSTTKTGGATAIRDDPPIRALRIRREPPARDAGPVAVRSEPPARAPGPVPDRPASLVA
ncbi:hypothetical protein ABZ297_27765 [Nonomuraea sp. NPDC005983]|uniref:hypothetical protein n=1 Tax=Nonomuraea sp. NPDC005983 TaxID=3155595 RepID=UPI0033A2254F